MRLESALLTSKEGMDTHGKAIAVVGDNISNANTTGFKSARSEFADLLATGRSDRFSETDGTVGDGSTLARVRTIHETGIIEPTGRSLDAGISGGGFFIVGDAENPQYSRNGTFRIDDLGRLVSEQGNPVLGTPAAGGALGELNVTQIETGGTPSSTVQLFGNLDAAEAITEAAEDPQTFSDIRSAASYTTTQSVYDSLGARHELVVAFFKTETAAGDGNTWVAQAYINGADVGETDGVPVQVGENAELAFDGSGTIPDAAKAAAIINGAPAYSNGATAGAFALDLGSMNQFAGGSLVNNVVQDGVGAGNISGYEFDSDGKFYAMLDSGERSLIGTVQLATFQNVDGLERSGSSLFSATADSGDRVIGDPGVGLFGSLEGATLERSTVDMAKEFVDLTIFQRGYQANTQVFSTTGQMIRETIGLIR